MCIVLIIVINIIIIIIIYVNCFGRIVICMCIEYRFYKINMYHVSAQGVDECMINLLLLLSFKGPQSTCRLFWRL